MKIRRAYRNLGRRLTGWMVRHFRWHGTVIDTNVPNVPFLKVKHLTVVNGYGQEHEITDSRRRA